MKKDKLKNLLITITSELRKLSKEELLQEATSARGFSSIMKEANLLSSDETQYEYLGTSFGSFDDYNKKGLTLYSVTSCNLSTDDSFAMAA